jgi:hypothetical protein
MKSVTSDPKNRGRWSGFGIPVNLVGGYRFPDARPLDRDLLVAILRTEGRLLPEDKPGSETVQPACNWEPSPNIDPMEVPDIPPFLDRRPKAEADRADVTDESTEQSRRAA